MNNLTEDLKIVILSALAEAVVTGRLPGDFAYEDWFESQQADARALWAVRVLDAQLASMPDVSGWEVSRFGDEYVVAFTDAQRDSIEGPWDDATGRGADAARLAAADAVYPELPESVRAELGARP